MVGSLKHMFDNFLQVPHFADKHLLLSRRSIKHTESDIFYFYKNSHICFILGTGSVLRIHEIS